MLAIQYNPYELCLVFLIATNLFGIDGYSILLDNLPVDLQRPL